MEVLEEHRGSRGTTTPLQLPQVWEQEKEQVEQEVDSITCPLSVEE
jgi:hypothetical protein